jgi:hypothetical protein
MSRPDRGSVTAEAGNSTVGHLEGAASARVTACPYLKGVTFWLERVSTASWSWMEPTVLLSTVVWIRHSDHAPPVGRAVSCLWFSAL